MSAATATPSPATADQAAEAARKAFKEVIKHSSLYGTDIGTWFHNKVNNRFCNCCGSTTIHDGKVQMGYASSLIDPTPEAYIESWRNEYKRQREFYASHRSDPKTPHPGESDYSEARLQSYAKKYCGQNNSGVYLSNIPLEASIEKMFPKPDGKTCGVELNDPELKFPVSLFWINK